MTIHARLTAALRKFPKLTNLDTQGNIFLQQLQKLLDSYPFPDNAFELKDALRGLLNPVQNNRYNRILGQLGPIYIAIAEEIVEEHESIYELLDGDSFERIRHENLNRARTESISLEMSLLTEIEEEGRRRYHPCADFDRYYAFLTADLSQTEHLNSPLFIACKYGYTGIVRAMLADPRLSIGKSIAGSHDALIIPAKPNYRYSEGGFLNLHVIAQPTHVTPARLLTHPYGTPLYVACQKGHLEIVQLLLSDQKSQYFSINQQYDLLDEEETANSSLTIALKNNQDAVVDYLLASQFAQQLSKQGQAHVLEVLSQGEYDEKKIRMVAKILIRYPNIDVNAVLLDKLRGWINQDRRNQIKNLLEIQKQQGKTIITFLNAMQQIPSPDSKNCLEIFKQEIKQLPLDELIKLSKLIRWIESHDERGATITSSEGQTIFIKNLVLMRQQMSPLDIFAYGNTSTWQEAIKELQEQMRSQLHAYKVMNSTDPLLAIADGKHIVCNHFLQKTYGLMSTRERPIVNAQFSFTIC